MCGRYFFSNMTKDEKLTAIVNMMERQFPDSYKMGEIFPGDTAPAVVSDHDRIRAVPAVFGFPGFQGNKLLLNARSETAADRPTFSDSLRARRIILPAVGFYEWSHSGKKEKFFFQVDGQSVLYLCGVYKIIDGECRFVILTRPANESMIETHDRMPVIVGEQDVRPYLTNYDAAIAILAAAAPMLRREHANTTSEV